MNRSIKINSVTAIYFGLAAVLIFAEYFKFCNLLFFFKPLLIPSLLLLYVLTAQHKSYWYIISLVFACISNVFLLFPGQQFVLMGVMAFLVYRIFSIITILKVSDDIEWLPLLLATIPFLFVFSYLIYIMISPDNPTFYPTVINDLIISIFSGMGLSNYVMNDNKPNSWLIISTLLFAFLVILFMVENFYLANAVFKPLSALIFAMAHYAFYKFMHESENHTTIDFP
jgi:uncharacterized membrane protein YhhN